MDYQGYSIPNIIRGDGRCTNDFSVDEKVIIGDKSANTDYTLPTGRGNVGDVIKQVDADGNCEFGSGGGTARVIQNLFQMNEPTYYYTNTGLPPDIFTPLYVSSTGSDIINTADLAVGSCVRLRTKGYLYNDFN